VVRNTTQFNFVAIKIQSCFRCSVRPMQSMFADRDAAFLEARKAVEAHNAIRLKSTTGTKLSTAEINSLAARRKAHNTHVLFEENSQLFEYKRVGDMKKWLQHLIMSEIAYHSACIEGLTQALQVAGQVDADVAMDAIRDQIMHPSITPKAREEAASAMSSPFTGIAVPPHLQPAASAVYSQAAVVALAGTSQPSANAAMTVPTPAQANILPEPQEAAPVSRAQQQGPAAVSATQPASFGPGASQTLETMPTPWATSPAGIAASGRNSPGALSNSPIAVSSNPPPAPMQPSSAVNAAQPQRASLFGAMKSIGFGRAKSASPARARTAAEPLGATTVDYSAMPPPSTT
jgi:hypothetical protein